MSKRDLGIEGELVRLALGPPLAKSVFASLEPMLPSEPHAAGRVNRAQFAAALTMLLFEDLLERVPSGRAYVNEAVAAGGKVTFDHGAVRTIRFAAGDTGALPGGELAIRRILEPLGYAEAGLYPLPRLRMTGRAFCHGEYPESLPQFFVSELHVDAFDGRFVQSAQRVFGASRDPLDAAAHDLLARFAKGETVGFRTAAASLWKIAAVFGRHHERPTLADYLALKSQSAEAAWIATEGNAFNHATDRVRDVVEVAAAQKRIGRPIKDSIEVSASGRVRQTAFRADQVTRRFGLPDESDLALEVPGSFYEFISRDRDLETGKLDLAFDSGNATGIFAMTRAA